MRKMTMMLLAVIVLLLVQVSASAGNYWPSYNCRPQVTWRNHFQVSRNYYGSYTLWQYRRPSVSYRCTPQRTRFNSGIIQIDPVERNPYVIPGRLLR